MFDWATSGKVLGELKRFNSFYGKPIENARDKDATEGEIQIGQRVNKELQELIQPWFLQRTKEEYLSDKLPPKREIVVFCNLSEEQRTRYSEFLKSRDVKDVLRGLVVSPLVAITWLKKLCGHPILVDKSDDDADKSVLNNQVFRHFDNEYIAQQSEKLVFLVDLVKHFAEEGHKTLIFSQSTKMLDIIDAVMSNDINFLRVDGQTKERDRQQK